jgi:hypothetical protein
MSLYLLYEHNDIMSLSGGEYDSVFIFSFSNNLMLDKSISSLDEGLSNNILEVQLKIINFDEKNLFSIIGKYV